MLILKLYTQFLPFETVSYISKIHSNHLIPHWLVHRYLKGVNPVFSLPIYLSLLICYIPMSSGNSYSVKLIFSGWPSGNAIGSFITFGPLQEMLLYHIICVNSIPAKPLHNTDTDSVHFNHFYCTGICDKLSRHL